MHRAWATRGFTLIELLIAVAVVAILAAVAYPSYQNQIAKARRAEIQGELVRLAQFMERLHTETGCYNPGEDQDCSGGDGAAPHVEIASDDYDVAFVGPVGPDTFTLQATPKPDGRQAEDGALRINHLGQRFWDENADGDLTDAGEDDWKRG